MSMYKLYVHDVTRVTVDTEEMHLDNGSGYTINRVTIESVDQRGNPLEFELTLFGLISEQGAMSVPFEFSKVEETV